MEIGLEAVQNGTAIADEEEVRQMNEKFKIPPYFYIYVRKSSLFYEFILGAKVWFVNF